MWGKREEEGRERGHGSLAPPCAQALSIEYHFINLIK